MELRSIVHQTRWQGWGKSTVGLIEDARVGSANEARPAFSLVDGELRITGTSGQDSIRVRIGSDRVEVTGSTAGDFVISQSPQASGQPVFITPVERVFTFPADRVRRITIDNGSGDDSIHVEQEPGVRADGIERITIAAGKGNDTATLEIRGSLATRVFADLGAGRDTIALRGVAVRGARGVESVQDETGFARTYDIDGDGVLSRKEFVDGMYTGMRFCKNPSPDEIRTVKRWLAEDFARLDVNKDNSLTRQEFGRDFEKYPRQTSRAEPAGATLAPMFFAWAGTPAARRR